MIKQFCFLQFNVACHQAYIVPQITTYPKQFNKHQSFDYIILEIDVLFQAIFDQDTLNEGRLQDQKILREPWMKKKKND